MPPMQIFDTNKFMTEFRADRIRLWKTVLLTSMSMNWQTHTLWNLLWVIVPAIQIPAQAGSPHLTSISRSGQRHTPGDHQLPHAGADAVSVTLMLSLKLQGSSIWPTTYPAADWAWITVKEAPQTSRAREALSNFVWQVQVPAHTICNHQHDL